MERSPWLRSHHRGIPCCEPAPRLSMDRKCARRASSSAGRRRGTSREGPAELSRDVSSFCGAGIGSARCRRAQPANGMGVFAVPQRTRCLLAVVRARRAADPFSGVARGRNRHASLCHCATSCVDRLFATRRPRTYRKNLEENMGKNRLEAFSDGVIAIIITIMVLEMKVPHGDSLGTLAPVVPVFMSYVLSFIYIGIYWNNHHHMLHAC